MSKNATDLIQSYFDPDAVARLAQATGLAPEMAGRVLETGVLLQLQALAESVKTPEGEAMIAESVQALPHFGSVAEALEESGGADHLQQAGEMLAPALLGDAADGLPAQVAAQTAADPAQVQTLLQMALPLLLSTLGQRGLNAGNIAPMLADLGGADLEGVADADASGTASGTQSLDTVTPAPVEMPEAAPVEPAAEIPVKAEERPVETAPVEEVPVEMESVEPLPVESVPVALEKGPSEAMSPEVVLPEIPAAPAESALPETTPPDPSTPEGLLKYLQARFGGRVGQKIGAVAGFGGGVRKQAALAALPVVLAALVGKAGAGGNLETLARPFAPLTDHDGQVNTDLLDSPVEVARIEGQGRGLMASLFGDVNVVTGRLGSALGGSGDSSRRLLALLTPLVLSALTRAHPNGLAALPMGGLADGLKGALPSGFSSLGVLVGSLATGTPLPGAAATTVQTTPRVVVQQGAPAAPPKPSPLKPPRPARFEKPAPPPPPPARRRGFPLWLIPLVLLLLLGGCWLVQNRQPAAPVTPTTVPDTASNTAPTSGAASGAAAPGAADSGAMPGMPVQPIFTDPQGGADVPASGFTLRGTGPVGDVLDVFLGDGKVGSATVGPDGNWSLDVGADVPQGPQTYTLKNAAGGEMAALNVVVGAADAATADPAPIGTEGPDSAAPDATATGAPADTTLPITGDSGGPALPGAATTDTPTASTVPFVITEPADGARVAADGLTLRGTGPAGELFALFHSGLRAGSVTVGPDGTWKADILSGAALPGPQSYDLRDAAGQVVARVRLQVAPRGQDVAGNAGAVSAGAGGITVSTPASGAQVSGAGFALSGNGPAGQTFEVLEDGVSIGSFTVGADGTWTRQVPGPSAGAKTYLIRAADGQQVASLPVTVGAAPASAQGAACAEELSVSLKDGETVTAPYRFGGVGSGTAYTVTVKRGERTVGSKTVPVGAACAWSFTSNPGAGAGQASAITYEVRPADASASDAPAARLTLNVR